MSKLPSALTLIGTVGDDTIVHAMDGANSRKASGRKYKDYVGAIDTRTAVTTTALDADVDYIRTAGYTTVGDGGHALFKRATSEPSHEGKVQSSDGAWWEIVAENGGVTVASVSTLSNANSAAVALGCDIIVSTAYTVPSTLTVTRPMRFVGAGLITVTSGQLLTVAEVTGGLRQCFSISNVADLKFSAPQTVYPEWWGTANTAVRSALKCSRAGSVIQLQGKEYETVLLNFVNNPLASDGADTGKLIRGAAGPAQRYKTTGAFYGTILKLAASQDTHVVSVTDGSGALNTWGQGGLENLMIDGNKGAQSAGAWDGINIGAVRDWRLENIIIWNCKNDGLNLEGANNQFATHGFIESFNNGRDGIRAAAIGDPQWNASVRCQNNDRHGFYIAGGYGRFSQIYCYFNTSNGFHAETTATAHLHIEYLRCEDNDLAGARIRGKNITIGAAEIVDNGVTGSADTEICGLWLDTAAENITIGTLSAAYRTAGGLTHKQKFLVYDRSLSGCQIGRISNRPYGLHSISGEQTILVHADSQTLEGCRVGKRSRYKDTYANTHAANVVTPLPDQYSEFIVTAVSADMSLAATAATRSPVGTEMEITLAADGSGPYNVTFDASYHDRTGASIAITAIPANQTMHLRFRRTSANVWELENSLDLI